MTVSLHFAYNCEHPAKQAVSQLYNAENIHRFQMLKT